MRDRQKIETLLARRFPGSTPGQIAAAANAIMALDDPSEKLFRSSYTERDEIADAMNGTRNGEAEGAVHRKTTQDRRS
jgi:hypothetical protein